MLAAFLDILKSIPDGFWGVLVGSSFSLLGVYLTNRGSENRLSAQFEHERKSKTKDREMDLRKEVFLAAAEALSAGMNAIGSFPNLDIHNDQVTQIYVEKSGAIAKAHLIATTETSVGLVRFTSRLGSLYISLFAKRYALANERAEITLMDNQVGQFATDRDKILDVIKQHNIDGIVDHRKWDVLQKNFEFEQQRIEETLARRAVVADSFQQKHLEFMRECLSHTTELGKRLVPLLLSVRNELELPIDVATFTRALDESQAEQQQAINDFIRTFLPDSHESK